MHVNKVIILSGHLCECPTHFFVYIKHLPFQTPCTHYNVHTISRFFLTTTNVLKINQRNQYQHMRDKISYKIKENIFFFKYFRRNVIKTVKHFIAEMP